MTQRTDYLAAFMIGAVVGVGATILLSRPVRKIRRRRLRRVMRPRR